MDTYLFVYVTIFLVAVAQIPIGVDLLRFMFPNWKLARFASRTVYFILFSSAGCIFCIGLGYHLFVYLPLLAGQESLLSVKGLIHIAFALWVWVNVVGNYYHSVSIHPGLDKDYKPPSSKPRLCVMSENGTITEVMEEGKQESTIIQRQTKGDTNDNPVKTQRPFYCDPSMIKEFIEIPKSGADWKPNRTHYCKVCQCAILYIDHHCPFTGNCTGLRNYSNFFLGLVYGTVGLLYAVIITLPYFFDCDLKKILWFAGIVSSKESSPVCQDLGPHSHIFMPVFAGFLITLNMLLLQVLFLASDLSTYDVLSRWTRFPMFRFMLQRIKARKCLDKDSRLNVLIISQRKNWFWYLVPVRNNS